MTDEEFLALPLAQKIEWLRSEDGPRGKLSHDRFAAELGTSRQVVIKWEKGAEPSPRLRGRLAAFSGYPAEAFARRGAEALAQELYVRRLEELAATVAAQNEEMKRSLLAVRRAIRRLERQLAAEAREGSPPVENATTGTDG